jgi:hypothetical protein
MIGQAGVTWQDAGERRVPEIGYLHPLHATGETGICRALMNEPRINHIYDIFVNMIDFYKMLDILYHRRKLSWLYLVICWR